MNLSRLMVLGLLASSGPRHGHQIRREAEQTKVGNWGGVNVGALYRELRRMEEDGLVEPVRSEQVGRWPARTIYQITEEGQRELFILRERAIRDVHHGPDTLSVALLFGRIGDRSELIKLLRARRQTIANALESIASDRVRGQVGGFLGPIDIAVFRRGEIRLEAELRWHDEFDKVLAEIPDLARQAETGSNTESKISSNNANK
jgi:DNA-binding PadR family transcriptional regulator